MALTNAVVTAAVLNGRSVALTATPLSGIQTSTTTTNTVNVIVASPPSVVSDGDLRIARQYDIEVATRAEMLLGVENRDYAKGQRILVRNDERLDGFWSIWAYAPQDEAANDSGLVFENVQTYRTSDFFDVIDWYADGYSPAMPPAITYVSIDGRNIGEGPNPTNTLVKVTNDGSNAWAWYLYDGAAWTLVARQKSTVRFKDTFFDATRSVFGVDSLDATQIPNRDGAWELRTLFNNLKSRVLSNAELNELFFSMVHFLHAQQDQIDWAFKTSFLSIVGYNEHLNQTPVQVYDTTQNLLDYVEEVKPYRVKTRDFKRVLTPELDSANVHPTDFDKPLYFDQRQNRYRRLNPANIGDMQIMQTTSPWKDWYDTYKNTDHDNPESSSFNPVRNFRMKMVFDRVDPFDQPLNSGFGWDLAPFDVLGLDGDETNLGSGGSATVRLFSYYPGAGMVENNKEELMDGYGFRGLETDGTDLVRLPQDASDWDVRGYDTSPEDIVITKEKENTVDGYQGRKVEVIMNDESEFFGLRDPHNEAGHPEELVSVQPNETVAFIAHTEWSDGAPNHYVTHVNTKRIRRTSVRIAYHGVASGPDAVLVYADGVRLVEGTNYTLNLAEAYVDVQLGRPRPENVMVHAFGVAGISRIIEQVVAVASGGTRDFLLTRAPVGPVEVVVDGRVLGPSEFTITGRTVSLLTAPVAGVVILSFEPGPANPSTHVAYEALPYNDAHKWDLQNRTEIGIPAAEHAGTIVELDGVRLTPPFTNYAFIQAPRQYVALRGVRNIKNLSVWIDGAAYPSSRIRRGDPETLDPNDASQPVGLYVVGEELFVNDESLVGKVLMASVFEDYDYTVNDGVLTVTRSIEPDSRIGATTFQNAQRMLIETYVFRGNPTGLYRICGRPADANCLVAQNGKVLTVGVDYHLGPYVDESVGWDVPNWDGLEWGGDAKGITLASALTIPGGQTPLDTFVVTVFRGRPVSEPSTWGMLSARPSLSMMGDPKLIMEWGVAPFDTVPVEAAVPVLADSPNGERAIYRMNGSWETFEWEVNEPASLDSNQGHLVSPVGPDDEEIRARMPVLDTEARYTMPNTDTGSPGAIWVNGERIEYFELVREGEDYVFRELRRSTRGTRLSAEQRHVLSATSNGVNPVFRLEGGNIATAPEVRVYADDGTHRDLQVGLDFTVQEFATAITVTLNRPAQRGANVRIGQSYALIHPQGTPVRNATQSSYDRKCPFRINDESTDLSLTTAGYAG